MTLERAWPLPCGEIISPSKPIRATFGDRKARLQPGLAWSSVQHASPVPVLFVHHRSELGGAPESLSYLIRELDREQFEPHVYCPPGPAADLFREAGAVVHTGAVSGFTHIWASTYRGRRWLLFGRELVRLPSHVHQFRQDLAQPAF